MTNTSLIEQTSQENIRRKRLWPWFFVGFSLVFISMGLSFKTSAIDLSAGALIQCNLLDYYYLETKAYLMHSGELGLFNPSFSFILMTLIMHSVCAIIGGVVLLGIAWGIRKLRS